MTRSTVWRYDDQLYSNGQAAISRGDHIEGLTGTHTAAELQLRAACTNCTAIRSTSLYVWQDQTLAERLWRLGRARYLYALEIDDTSIRHVGDVNCFSAVVDALANTRSPDDPINRYWRGAAEPGYSARRIEILVSGATVLSMVASKP